MKTSYRVLFMGCSALALAGCGPDEISSPGTGGDVIINNPAPTPAPTPTPTPTQTVSAASGCPTISDAQGLTDEGTISGPTGQYRICAMPARFNTSSTLPYIEGLLYRMPGRVDVGTDGGPTASAADTNVTLSIEPGAMVYASGAAFLMVNRGNQIDAEGTAERPIIFTSRDNVLGLNSDSSSGQWGGVVLGGRAPVTDCIAPGATPGTTGCERQVEGAAQPALFGGATPGDSSGSMKFVQIRYSGFVLSGDNELQSLTTGGSGSGTVLENIMSYNSSDDGVEFFGGRVNVKRLIVVGAEDDSIDTDTGVKANLQQVIAIQRQGAGDTIIEADSTNGLEEQTPRQNTIISNAVFQHRNASASQAIRIRGAADYTIANTVVVADSGVPCIRVDQPETLRAAGAGADEAGPVRFESTVLDCASAFRDGSGGVTAAQVQARFDAGSNNIADFINTLGMLFINGSNESGASAFNATSLGSFFENLAYVGAVRDENDGWFTQWTCNSSAVSFGNDNTGNCASLPIY
ncbi:hypothetical protein HME9302_02069 [Alteripontixanthobacter maritimus]|uniref:Uncharacterized protein n=2 Tax=Alteripontixanthobacter maritimus TaxID=2161824 RepID=A0A369Q7K3_9SPHN|nr:hypothetical protein HME9302_02069 [Alteripontixanthobacter maritimus]